MYKFMYVHVYVYVYARKNFYIAPPQTQLSRMQDDRVPQFSRDTYSGYFSNEGSSQSSGHGRGGGYRGRGGGDGGYRGRGRGGFRVRSGLGFKKSYNDEVREQVEELLGKKFHFQDEYEQWNLPAAEDMFRHEPFEVPKLLRLKENLNSTKAKLNNKEMITWHKHTNFTNRAGIIISALRRDYQPEMCTQGWAKFHEILCQFGTLVPESASKLNSVHLCEAPGGFVASLNHFLKTHRMDCEWKWKAMTLNPYFEGNGFVALIDQDKFMSETWPHWYLGGDNSGDVMVWENVVGLRAAVKEEMKEVHLVTADGSINCADNPGEQEGAVAQLIYCETVTALLLLKAGGSLVLKTFTTLECQTLCLMYLLACCFNELHIFKPVTSKAGNSEQYVICIGYKGTAMLTQKHLEKLGRMFGETPPRASMFPVNALPQSFLTQMVNCSTKFAKYQVDTIEENIRLYDCMRHSEKQFIQEVKELTCDTYKSRFMLKELPREKAVVQNMFLNGSHLYSVGPLQGDPALQWLHRRSTESFLTRMEQRKRAWSERLMTEEEPPSKLSRSLSDGSTSAIQYVLSSLGYESGDRKSSPGSFLLEMLPEEVQWTKGPVNKPISLQELKSLDGRTITKIENSRFCRPDILKKLTEAVENAKILRPSHSEELSHITSHLLPGHVLSSTSPPFYLGPQAVNYAALDYLIDFTSKPDREQTMTLVDLAGAPSEFSHYVFWKRQHFVKGWGMVRVESPRLGPGRVIDQLAQWETFQVLGPHSGVNICDTNSIKSLCAGVENYCPGGVNLLVGDSLPMSSGANPPGYAESQAKQQLLAQCLCACRILKSGGMFICRVYELLSRFSASLVYLMYRVFEEVIVLKPMTSCPTSPERFLVCRGFNGCKTILTEMLLEVNSHMSELRASGNARQDVLELIPMQLLLGEEQFYRFLTLSNERIAKHCTQWITLLEKTMLSSEMLPSAEQKALLRKGTLEILQLPATPARPQKL